MSWWTNSVAPNLLDPVLPTGATASCNAKILYALGTGRVLHAITPNPTYERMMTLTRTSVWSAGYSDFQRLFKCTGECGDRTQWPTSCSAPPCNACRGDTPTKVTVDGRKLLVADKVYHINGVCWSPIDIGGGFGNEKFDEWMDKDIPKMKEAGINAVRVYNPILDLRILDRLHDYGIMVMQPIPDKGGSATEADILEVVMAVKDHPAILMWNLGNEWNLNTFYNKDLSVENCVEWIEFATGVIKKVDKNHPVATTYGDVPPAIESMQKTLPGIDVWALNAYRLDTFNGLFPKWEKDLVPRPLILGEFGADAWDSRVPADTDCGTSMYIGEKCVSEDGVTVGGREAASEQARIVTSLMTEINDFSVKGQNTTEKQVNSGGFIFEWSDEWWKRGAADVQDTDGLAPCPQGCGPAPDRSWNEDWWGLSTISRDYEKCGAKFVEGSDCPLRESFYAYKEAPKPSNDD